MKERIRKTFNSLYWRQFALTAGMVLLTMVLLGVSFFALSFSINVSERRSEMRSRAELIAQMSLDYFAAGIDQSADQDEALRKLAVVASRMTDVDFLICNTQGGVVLTTDENLVGKSLKVPETVVEQTLSGDMRYEGRGTLGGIYEAKQYVVGVPIEAGDVPIGMVLAVMDAAALLEMWRAFIGLFFITSITILLVAFLASSVTAMRQIQPITEMVEATRAYADGNFDVRMSNVESSAELAELASSFNAMADSLQETERQRRDFIANVSHELKTPMTTIAGYTDGILDGTIPPEKERQYLQIISDESRRLSRLVRRMLDISQIQSKEMKKKDFDLCESMRLALLSMEQRIIDRHLDVEADIPDEPVMVQGDNDLITQVIYNLVENAAKFATPGTALYLGVRTTGEKALVTVRNHGATIAAQEIPLLFERFHKSDKSRSEDKDGYGLGLYVVKTILNQHKEKITVTSEDGVTSFVFTMQRSQSAYSKEEESTHAGRKQREEHR